MTRSDFDRLRTWLPEERARIDRLEALASERERTRVTALGKYNHGKSTLLNVLAGRAAFAVADRRETRAVQTVEAGGVLWVDTPGLDADVAGQDDRRAVEAAIRQSDVLLVVHNVRTGELDAHEYAVCQRWVQEPGRLERTALVLTQIDQLYDEELERVLERIEAQVPELRLFPVSAQREASGKAALQRRSGMEALRHWLAVQQEGQGRAREQALLRRTLYAALQQRRQAVEREREGLNEKRRALKRRFKKAVREALSGV